MSTAVAEPSKPPLEFRGIDGFECERFVHQVRKRALEEGKARDNEWVCDFAAAHITGAALRFYEDLDEEIQQDWKKLQVALLKNYPVPEDRDPATPRPSSFLPFGAPAAAAPPPEAAPLLGTLSLPMSPAVSPTPTKVATPTTATGKDSALDRWKQSLGLVPPQTGSLLPATTVPKATLLSMNINFPQWATGLKNQTITVDLTNKPAVALLTMNPFQILQGVQWTLSLSFRANHGIVSGLRYKHIVKKAGIKADKMDWMLGSYAPSLTAGGKHSCTSQQFEMASGVLARSGTYMVRSTISDDDGEIYADFEWAYKLLKSW